MFSHLFYLFFWAIVTLLLILLNNFFPNNIALGNARFVSFEAAIYAGFWIMFLVTTIQDFISARGVKITNSIIAIFFFLGANTTAIWMVARFAHIIGLGISSWKVALLVGGLFSLFQRLIINSNFSEN